MAHLWDLQLFELVFQFLSHKEAMHSLMLVLKAIQKKGGLEREQDL